MKFVLLPLVLHVGLTGLGLAQDGEKVDTEEALRLVPADRIHSEEQRSLAELQNQFFRDMIRLELDADDLAPSNLETLIKNAYRRQAKKHHPDLGGRQETFLKIQEAYEKLSQWAKRPTFIRQRGFPDKWLYQGATNRWIKPILPRKKK